MRACPFPACDWTMPDRSFCCTLHWRCVSEPQRRRIIDAFHDYLDDRSSLFDLRCVHAEVLAAASGISLALAMEAVMPDVAWGEPCPDCGQVVMRAFFGRILLSLEEIPQTFHPQYSIQYAVIGRVACPADGLPSVYARFREHVCTNPRPRVASDARRGAGRAHAP